MLPLFFRTIVLLLAAVLLSLISCEPCTSGPNSFRVLHLDGSLQRLVTLNGQWNRPVLDQPGADSLDFDELVIQLKPLGEVYQAAVPINFSFFTEVSACSPAEPATRDRIDSVRVYCQRDFNAQYPAGSDMRSLFDAVVFDWQHSIYYERFSLELFTESAPTFPSEMYLLLNTPPDSAGSYAFEAVFYLDGPGADVVDISTQEIALRP